MHLPLNLGRLNWSSFLHLGLVRFVQITSLKGHVNRLQIYFWVTGILRKSLLTTLRKLLSLGITSGHLALLIVQFMWDFSGLNLLVSWFPIRFFFSSVIRCYIEVSVRIIFITRAAFRSSHKNLIPISQQSNLLYKFQCCFNATYRGRTSQHLEVRGKQHVPRDIRNRITFGHSKLLDSVSIWAL